jgi:hypothetical protein
MDYNNLLDYPKEEKPVLIRDEDSVLGIYSFYKELNGIENVYAKQGDLHNFFEATDNDLMTKNYIWSYFEEIPRGKFNEVAKCRKRFSLRETKDIIVGAIKEWVKVNYHSPFYKKLEFPAYCFILGGGKRSTFENKDSDVFSLLKELVLKEFVGKWRNDDFIDNSTKYEMDGRIFWELDDDCFVVAEKETISKDITAFLDMEFRK